MSDRIDRFIQALEASLKGVPQEEKEEAVNYYREYLSDAGESCADLGVVIEQLGSAEKIAGEIRMENSIIRARKNPGIRNYANVLNSTFRIVTTPLTILLLSLSILLSGSIVLVFFASAICTFLASIVICLALIYEITNMPGQFFMEIMGGLGLGLLTSGTLLLLTLCFYKLGVLFIRISVWMIEKINRKPRSSNVDSDRNAGKKQRRLKALFRVIIIQSVLGLVLLFVSGLPMRYFWIFNSMNPENIEIQSYEYEPGEVDEITVVTAHSMVRLTEGNGDKVRFVYQNSDWLDCEFEKEGKKLRFIEKSNGSLPLFELVSLHESMTELEISIPKGFEPKKISVESKGGHVILEGISRDIDVETMNGRIEVNRNDAGASGIIAKTAKGDIYINGVHGGKDIDGETSYTVSDGADHTLTLNSKNGDIYIQ